MEKPLVDEAHMPQAAKTGSDVPDEDRSGSLKIFFAYAPLSGATTTMLAEAEILMTGGREVIFADPVNETDDTAPFDLDVILERHPDVVVIGDLAQANPEGARNRTRYQDAVELLRAGIDIYATLRVAELQNEQDHIAALGVTVPEDPVPDHIFYGADSVRFIDADPADIVERASGVDPALNEQILAEMRIIALRCVNAYVSSDLVQSEDEEREQTAETRSARGCVVAMVNVAEPPGRILLEAQRIAATSHTEVEVICVRTTPRAGSAAAARDDAAYAALEEQVEAMGLELITIFSDDPADAVRDYLRTQGATDVVVSHRRTSWARRIVLPVQLPFEERIVNGLDNVTLHAVAADESLSSVASRTRARRAARRQFYIRDIFIALIACIVAFLLIRLFQNIGFGEAASYVVFLAAFVAVAIATRRLIPSFLAVIIGCLAQDYFFVRNYQSFNIDHRASLFVLILFTVISCAAVVGIARLGRSADRADRRERRTQALFNLNHSMLYAHGIAEAVDIALDTVTRLFGRSTAIYLCDPFDDTTAHEHHPVAMRIVPDDPGGKRINGTVDQSVAHWVFTNGEKAGAGTDTHATSDLYYLPLISRGGIQGVLVISMTKPMNPSDLSFLDLMTTQIAQALERQSLAAKHVEDLDAMYVTSVRNSFSQDVLDATARDVSTLHTITDALIGLPDEDRTYRDALIRALSDESGRTYLMTEDIRDVLDEPITASCDLRAEVSAAVEEVREDIFDKHIDLLPGEPMPLITADAPLVRAAIRYIIHASAGHTVAGGVIQVSVSSYTDHVSVFVADDRSDGSETTPVAAFEVDEDQELSYDRLRAKQLRETLLDHSVMRGDQQEVCAALSQAMCLPPESLRTSDDPTSPINRQRMIQLDRLEYDLYLAALIAHVHGGTVYQRYRLGGGSVITFTLPRT